MRLPHELFGEPWMNQAACAGQNPNIFFPERGGPIDQAHHVCHHCPVQTNCLDYALTNHIRHGIWGGHSPRDRRRIARQRTTKETR